MASVHNRIVERALLDVLQSKSTFVRNVVTVQTSVGGVPDRSVPHGIKLIDEAFKSGCRYFVRSDISGFFDSIARKSVLERIGAEINDEKFMDLLERATTVTLANEHALGEDKSIFPTDELGVAQGSPLSPLFGNILLYEFDQKFNGDGVVCVRFIDDFILISKDERRAIRAFESAKRYLCDIGLVCHDPFVTENKKKAEKGRVEDGFVFLGYDIRPGLFQPSEVARKEVLKSVKERIAIGKKEIVSVMRTPHSDNSPRYSQTMVGIDRAIRGWGNAFAYGNAPETIEQLDLRIDEELASFRNWYADIVRQGDWKLRRRTGGVCLLSDIEPKSLEDVPFKIEQGGRFVQSKLTLTISTDGSVAGSRRHGRDKGPGGWAFLIHENEQKGSGFEFDVTNNQMELRAVIEAIKATPVGKSIRIRTDSQYVQKIASGETNAKSNTEMWREYQSLANGRKIKVVWVKGHAGDAHNERVDRLAKLRSEDASRFKASP